MRLNQNEFTIPHQLNTVLVILQILFSILFLKLASISSNIWIMSVWAFLFSMIMQMGFSLIHEAEHGKLHKSPKINECMGVFLSALFPGSYHFMRIAHLSHHRRNRTDSELVDYVLPSEKTSLKTLMYYFLITGGVWVGVPLASLLISVTSFLKISEKVSDSKNSNKKTARQLYLEFMKETNPKKVRFETFLVILFWVVLIYFFSLSATGIVVSYLFFAFSWSSQQYIYHIRTPRHIVEGAYNLRLWKPIQLLYLNFNYHLSHHRYPKVPWIHMADLPAEPLKRCYWKTYSELWAPPEPIEKSYFI